MYQDLLVYCREPSRWPGVLAYARSLLTPGAGIVVRLHDPPLRDELGCVGPSPEELPVTHVARGPQPLVEALVEHAAWADAVLIDGPDDLAFWRSVVSDCARPCLVLPGSDGESPPPPPQHIGLGWNGSLQCRRALYAALPLLRDAGRVVVFHAADHAGDADAACAHLGRHGIGTLRTDSSAVPEDACARLRELSLCHGLDLLVLGAFPHVRFSEWDGAGTLAQLLRSSPIPLLLAH
jgi:nucleotide-binding universal stress UspA family protein